MHSVETLHFSGYIIEPTRNTAFDNLLSKTWQSNGNPETELILYFTTIYYFDGREMMAKRKGIEKGNLNLKRRIIIRNKMKKHADLKYRR